MTSSLPRGAVRLFRWLLSGLAGCAAYVLVMSAHPVLAQSDPPAPSPPAETLIRQMGIGGVWKLGHPCAVSVRLPNNSLGGSVASADAIQNESSAIAGESAFAVEVTTVDGDAVEVTYRKELEPAEVESSNMTEVVVPIQIGRSLTMLSARWVDRQGREIAREDRVLSQEGLPPTQPLLVAVGSLMGVDEIVRTSADRLVQSISLVEITEARDLPLSWLEYQPVDLLVFSTSNMGLLHEVSPAQWKAIDDFIRRGGGCILTLGGAVHDLREFDQLVQWLPGGITGEGLVRNPAALESLVTTDQPLEPFPTVQLDIARGRTRLSLTDSLGQQSAWWISLSHGFGTIQVVGSDLDHPSFARWKHRRMLWERLVSTYFDKSELDSVKAGGVSMSNNSYLGYSDLTGQLRATLEQFSGVSVVSFGQAAAILIGLLILLGPVDYFISVRWLERPHWSWWIAGSILLLSSLGLVWYYSILRPDQILSNTARIIDVDAQSGRVDGHQWSHIYSARARQVTVQAVSNFSGEPIRLDWQGMPGTGLGGLQSSMRIERGMPSYRVDLLPNSGSQIVEVGIPAAGTKSFYAAWSEVLPQLQSTSSTSDEIGRGLREMATVDQLEGDVVNPLDVDLRDAVLFYHRWFYSLQSRLPAGGRIGLSAQIIPRDISRRLNRQQEIDGKLTTDRWDPAGRDQLDRLLELMMFHKAATGSNYTSLTHRFQPIVDHSSLLESDSALLIGRLDWPASQLTITSGDTKNPPIQTDTDRTWVRILLPVDSGYSQKRTR